MLNSLKQRYLRLPLGILIVCLLSLAHAQETPSEPTYLGRKIAQTMHYTGANWLTRHNREQEEASETMRKELNLKPGMNVCDMGSGNGYHTIPMAKAIAPDGKAYAVDIQQPMLDMLAEAADKAGVSNIVRILGAEDSSNLPEASCDLILLVDVYHEFSKPEAMLISMKKALKPHGQIVLVEFRAEDESVPIKTEHKMSKAQITKEMNANGLKLSRSFDKLPWQHMMWFEAGQPALPPTKSDSPTK